MHQVGKAVLALLYCVLGNLAMVQMFKEVRTLSNSCIYVYVSLLKTIKLTSINLILKHWLFFLTYSALKGQVNNENNEEYVFQLPMN